MSRSLPLCFLLGVLQFQALRLSPFWVHFGVWCKIRVQYSFFAHGYPVFPTPFIKETILSSLCVLGVLVKQLTIYVWVYYWALYFVPLVYVYICSYASTMLFWLLYHCKIMKSGRTMPPGLRLLFGGWFIKGYKWSVIR